MKMIHLLIPRLISPALAIEAPEEAGRLDAPPWTKASDILKDTTDIDPTGSNFSDISSIINALLPPLFTIAGLILLFMLIAGGFSLLTAGTDAKKAEAGKARLTSAVTGFFIIFAAYWITQILEIVLGISIFK